MPTTRMRVDISDAEGGGSTMAIATTFPPAEVMEQLVTMGMEEGMTLAVGQIDDLLAVVTG